MTKRNPSPSPKAKHLITRLINRTEDFAFLGAANPLEHYAIERGFERAKRDLLEYLEQLERRPATVRSDILPKE